jgi:hypothetical protein
LTASHAPEDGGIAAEVGGNDMLWYCKFEWHPHTTAEAMRRRILEQDNAGANHPERVRGWYNLAGGGAGFMLIEADDPRDLTDMLEPYMDLLAWDVHAVSEQVSYEETIESFRRRSAAEVS